LLRIGFLLVLSGVLTARAQLLALARPGVAPDLHMIGLLGIAAFSLSVWIPASVWKGSAGRG